MNARTVAAAFTIFTSTDIQMDLWNARIARFFREVINIFIDFSEYQISLMSIVDPFSEESERVQEALSAVTRLRKQQPSSQLIKFRERCEESSGKRNHWK